MCLSLVLEVLCKIVFIDSFSTKSQLACAKMTKTISNLVIHLPSNEQTIFFYQLLSFTDIFVFKSWIDTIIVTLVWFEINFLLNKIRVGRRITKCFPGSKSGENSVVLLFRQKNINMKLNEIAQVPWQTAFFVFFFLHSSV